MEEKKPSRVKNIVKRAAQWIGVFTGAWLLFHYVFPIVVIAGQSMEPTFHDGDLAICNGLHRSCERGDVIIFRGTEAFPYRTLIKRVTAVAGDVVDMDLKTGVISVNGEVVVDKERASPPDLTSISLTHTHIL